VFIIIEMKLIHFINIYNYKIVMLD